MIKNNFILAYIVIIFSIFIFYANFVNADELDCITTEWKLFGSNHKVCTSSYQDPDIPQITCYIAQARTGGVTGMVGLAEDPSNFSLTCIKTNNSEIQITNNIKKKAKVFSESTNAFFKTTSVIRTYDNKTGTFVYTAVSRKIIDGSPFNAISAVPIK
jgi:CreA protein